MMSSLYPQTLLKKGLSSYWLAGSKERRPRLGISVLPVELPTALRQANRTGEAKLVIAAVERGGAADRAGLLVGDVLLGVAGETVADAESLLDALARAGDTGRLRVARGGAIFEVDVDLGAQGPGRAA